MTPIQMAAKFHDARDLWKRLHGARWHAELHYYTAQLRRLMMAKGVDVVHAVLLIGKHLKEIDMMEAFTPWLAAACEIAEPTP